MRWNIVCAAIIVALISAGTIRPANAQCTVPNLISNGQTADATLVMNDFNALLSCINTPAPVVALQFAGAGGGIVTMQNPGATSNYNFNLPATSGSAGDVLTSGGGASTPNSWTPTGTTGHALPFLDGNNVWSGVQAFGPVVGTVSTQAATTYTLAAGDCGTTIRFTSSSAITLTTLNSLPVGCSIAIEQGGSGQVTIAAGAGTTQHSAHAFTKTFGQYAILGLFVDTNTGGSAADIIITGDGA